MQQIPYTKSNNNNFRIRKKMQKSNTQFLWTGRSREMDLVAIVMLYVNAFGPFSTISRYRNTLCAVCRSLMLDEPFWKCGYTYIPIFVACSKTHHGEQCSLVHWQWEDTVITTVVSSKIDWEKRKRNENRGKNTETMEFGSCDDIEKLKFSIKLCP